MTKGIQNLFSVTKDSLGRKVIIFLGKTFVLNPIGFQLEQIKTFLELSTDISQLPKATGLLRLVQEGNSVLLKQITDYCTENNLTYWINYGTLLGAVRHKGFIPWDDDLDICMPRDDWEKLIKLLDEKFKNSNYCYHISDCLRIFYKNTPLQLDIFPLDYYYKNIESQEEVEHLFNKIRKAKSYIKYPKITSEVFDYGLNLSPAEVKQLHNDIVMEGNSPIQPASLVRAIETQVWHLSYYKYDWIFPLQKIEFEGNMYFAPNKISTVLYENYGDYMKYPKTMTHLHKNIKNKMSIETISFLEDFIKENK